MNAAALGAALGAVAADGAGEDIVGDEEIAGMPKRAATEPGATAVKEQDVQDELEEELDDDDDTHTEVI